MASNFTHSKVIDELAHESMLTLHTNVFKVSYLLHLKTQSNWKIGTFENVFGNNGLQFDHLFTDLNHEPATIIGLNISDANTQHFPTIHVWSNNWKTMRRYTIGGELAKDISAENFQPKDLIKFGDIFVMSISGFTKKNELYNECKLISLRSDQTEDLDVVWSHQGENEDWKIFQIDKKKLFKTVKDEMNHFKIEEICISSGKIVNSFSIILPMLKISKVVTWNSW